MQSADAEHQAAFSAYDLAAAGYKARSGSMTQQQKDVYAACMADGSDFLRVGDAHMKAGADRVTIGDGKVAEGDVRYANQQYQLAIDCYDCAPNPAVPIGATQHFAHACDDYGWAAQCFLSAKTSFVYAWNQTNPP